MTKEQMTMARERALETLRAQTQMWAERAKANPADPRAQQMIRVAQSRFEGLREYHHEQTRIRVVE